jgi:hypothetical protein
MTRLKNSPDPVCVAFKAHMGWVNAVAVKVEADSPRPLLAQRIDLVEGEDREMTEPYHVAGGWQGLKSYRRPEYPEAIIRRGTALQISSAIIRLKMFAGMLTQQALQWSGAVVLTGRGFLGDDLEHILGSHAHIHVAEGEAIRSATRHALDSLGISFANQDEKSILPIASDKMACSVEDCDKFMKSVKPPNTKSWRKEERLIALGAWLNCHP